MKRVFWMLVVALTAGAECVEIPETRFGRLSVEAYDVLGNSLTNPEIEITGPDSRRVKFSNGRRLRFGRYSVSVVLPGFYPARREIVIDQPKLVARVELSIGHDCYRGFGGEITGTVKDANLSDVWVKGIRLRGTEAVETRVDPRSGRYVLRGMPGGEYVVLVMRGRDVLHQRVVSALRDEPVNF